MVIEAVGINETFQRQCAEDKQRIGFRIQRKANIDGAESRKNQVKVIKKVQPKR